MVYHIVGELVICGIKQKPWVIERNSSGGTYNRVNHKALPYKLKVMGIGGSSLNISKKFLTDRTHTVYIDGLYSDHRNVISGVTQGSVQEPLLFII